MTRLSRSFVLASLFALGSALSAYATKPTPAPKPRASLEAFKHADAVRRAGGPHSFLHGQRTPEQHDAYFTPIERNGSIAKHVTDYGTVHVISPTRGKVPGVTPIDLVNSANGDFRTGTLVRRFNPPSLFQDALVHTGTSARFKNGTLLEAGSNADEGPKSMTWIHKNGTRKTQTRDARGRFQRDPQSK